MSAPSKRMPDARADGWAPAGPVARQRGATPVALARFGLILIGRGEAMRGFRTVRPHRYMPLAPHAGGILSADRRRLIRRNHDEASDAWLGPKPATCGPGSVPVALRGGAVMAP